MIATRKRRKPNSSKENISDSNRNHKPIGVSASRFQILSQVSDECVNLVHAAPKDIPSTSRQPLIPILNLTFTSNNDTITKTLARHKRHTKAVATKSHNRKPTTLMNPIQNPFQSNVFHIRENDINSPPHANPNYNPRLIPQFDLSNQQFFPLATTFDPTKHTVVFCSSQTLLCRDVRDMATTHRYQQ